MRTLKPSHELAANLTTVKNLLVAEGWRQNAPGMPGGPKCLVGACYYGLIPEEHWENPFASLNVNTPGEDRYTKTVTAIIMYLHTSIIGWNDSPGRTEPQVLEMLDEMIAAVTPEPVSAPEVDIMSFDLTPETNGVLV